MAQESPVVSTEYQHKLDRLERMILRGVRNQYELATIFGMPVPHMSIMLKDLQQRTRNRDRSDLDEQRHYRVSQIDSITHMALDAFDRSRETTEEWTTTTQRCTKCNGTGADLKKIIGTPLDCPMCFGQGKDEHLPGKWLPCKHCKGSGQLIDAPSCLDCGGKGKFVIETTRTKDSPGDPAFLALATRCVEAAAKLEGLYPQTGTFQRTIINETRTLGIQGEVRQRVEEVFYEAPSELILKAMAVMDEMDKSIRDGQTQRVIEVQKNEEEVE